MTGPMTGVEVSPRVAAFLHKHLDLRRVRVEVRGADAEVDRVLIELAVAARTFSGSATGTFIASEDELMRKLFLSTSAAADRLGISPRGVVAAIASRRLRASKTGGRWLIAASEVDIYRSRERRSRGWHHATTPS